MSDKFHNAFHGHEWLTHRPTVAQAFDTLDRICELCHPAPLASQGEFPHAEATGAEGDDVLTAILELCDDLSGELDAAEADLFPVIYGDPALRWSAFEIRLHLKQIRETAMNDPLSGQHHDALEAIRALAGRARDLLRHIDQ